MINNLAQIIIDEKTFNAIVAVIIFIVGLIIIFLAYLFVNRKNNNVSPEEAVIIELYQTGKISYNEYRHALEKIRYSGDTHEKNN